MVKATFVRTRSTPDSRKYVHPPPSLYGEKTATYAYTKSIRATCYEEQPPVCTEPERLPTSAREPIADFPISHSSAPPTYVSRKQRNCRLQTNIRTQHTLRKRGMYIRVPLGTATAQPQLATAQLRHSHGTATAATRQPPPVHTVLPAS